MDLPALKALIFTSPQDMVAVMEFVGIIALIKFIMLQRQDIKTITEERKEAWKDIIHLTERSNQAINNLTLIVEGVKERIK